MASQAVHIVDLHYNKFNAKQNQKSYFVDNTQAFIGIKEAISKPEVITMINFVANHNYREGKSNLIHTRSIQHIALVTLN